MIEPLLQGQFSSGLGKVLVYVQLVTRSLDSSRAALRALEEKRVGSLDADQDDWEKRRAAIERAYGRGLINSIGFARRNLDSAQLQALEELVWRPRLASKADLEKRALALQRASTGWTIPPRACWSTIRAPRSLNKYLWPPLGHEYLQKRNDPGGYDLALCGYWAARILCRQSGDELCIHCRRSMSWRQWHRVLWIEFLIISSTAQKVI